MSLKRKVWMAPSSVPTANHKGCVPVDDGAALEVSISQFRSAVAPIPLGACGEVHNCGGTRERRV
eukprot:4756875-Amphidinium_carterae.1